MLVGTIGQFTNPRMPVIRVVILVLCATAGALLPPAAASDAPRQADQPRTIEVVARRFAFEPPEIEAIAGEPLRIIVHSSDGVHGFEIKKFKVSKLLKRGGEPVIIEFTPKDVGRFPIVCSLFCGDGHEEMKGALIVQARDEGSPQ